MATKQVKCWLVLNAVRNYGGQVSQVKPHKVTLGKPNNIDADQIAFPLEIEIDTGWFDTPTPVVKIDLPAPAPEAAPTVVADTQQVVRARQKSSAATVIRNSKP